MFKKSLISLALTVATATSFAQVYIQGAAGQGTVNVDAAAPTTVKKTATGSKLALGYEYGNGWAVEGMIISFGKSVATTNTGTTADIKATSFAIGGVYSGDLGNGHGLKGGLYYGRNKADATGNALAAASVNAQTVGGVNVGLGYSYSFNKTAALTVDYDLGNFKNQLALPTASTFTASLLSVGVRFKF